MSEKEPVVNKVLGTCTVCNTKVFEYNQFLKVDRKVFHQHCIPGATLKATLETNDLLRQLTKLLENTER